MTKKQKGPNEISVLRLLYYPGCGKELSYYWDKFWSYVIIKQILKESFRNYKNVTEGLKTWIIFLNMINPKNIRKEIRGASNRWDK